jgi:hypothetical protein
MGSRNALEGMREAGPYIGLGFQLFAAILIFTGGGYWLDTQLGTLPGLTLGGAAVAFGVIMYLVLNMANEAQERADRKRAESADGKTAPGSGSGSGSGNASPFGRGGPDFHSGHKRRASKDD